MSASLELVRSSIKNSATVWMDRWNDISGIFPMRVVENSVSPIWRTRAPGNVGHSARIEVSITFTDTCVRSLGGTSSNTPGGAFANAARSLSHCKSGCTV